MSGESNTKDKAKDPPNHKTLRNDFTYDISTGELKRKTKKGSTAARPKKEQAKDTYKTTTYNRITYKQHRLIWTWLHDLQPPIGIISSKPSKWIIDHRNRVKTDNAANNLRLATWSDNSRNKLMKTKAANNAGTLDLPNIWKRKSKKLPSAEQACAIDLEVEDDPDEHDSEEPDTGKDNNTTISQIEYFMVQVVGDRNKPERCGPFLSQNEAVGAAVILTMIRGKDFSIYLSDEGIKEKAQTKLNESKSDDPFRFKIDALVNLILGAAMEYKYQTPLRTLLQYDVAQGKLSARGNFLEWSDDDNTDDCRLNGKTCSKKKLVWAWHHSKVPDNFEVDFIDDKSSAKFKIENLKLTDGEKRDEDPTPTQTIISQIQVYTAYVDISTNENKNRVLYLGEYDKEVEAYLVTAIFSIAFQQTHSIFLNQKKNEFLEKTKICADCLNDILTKGDASSPPPSGAAGEGREEAKALGKVDIASAPSGAAGQGRDGKKTPTTDGIAIPPSGAAGERPKIKKAPTKGDASSPPPSGAAGEGREEAKALATTDQRKEDRSKEDGKPPASTNRTKNKRGGRGGGTNGQS